MGRFNSLVGSKISSVGALAFRSKTNSVDLLTFDPADNRVQIDKFLGLSPLTAPTIATGVLTVTGSLVDPQPETSCSFISQRLTPSPLMMPISTWQQRPEQ